MPSEQPDHLNIRLQIDAIADQYEKSSAAETDPERRAATIRQLLQYHLSLPQAALLLELLSIELERAVPEPQLRSLFPDHSDVVEQVIQHEKRAAQGFDPGPPTVISAPVAKSSEPLPVIPGYELLQCIGRGGMGAVYRAIQHGTRKTVAVKTILAKWSGNDRAVKRFENECLAAARLDNHPHMARVLELGECPDGQRFYAMDYIEGQNLKQRIQLACDEVSRHRSVSGSKRDTPAAATDSTLPAKSADQEQSASEPANRIYPNADFLRTVASEKQSAGGHRAFEQAVRIGIDAADALAYAHEAGIVHRDIKPANLLLDQKTGHVVVADFGLAQITEHQLTQAITNPGEVMGTYGYMSPEQLLGNRVVVDSLTDVFSLGATLYELLTLQPIRRGTDAEIMRAIAFEDPVRMRKLVPAIPEDLETIIHAAIASRPQDRYQSMARFRDDLQRWLDRKPIQARPPGLLKRASLWVERNQKLSAVISSAVLVILFILGVAWRIQAQQTLVQSRLKDEQQELKEEAIAQSKENKSLYLVASSHLERDNDPTLATLLAIEAQKLHKSPEATAALVMAMRENHEVRSWNVRDADVREGHMVVHPDMTSVVTTVSYTELQSEHTNLPAVESDVAAGRVIHQYDTGGVVIGAEWSNDGKKLLLCSAARVNDDSETIQLTFSLWDRRSPKQLPNPLMQTTTTLKRLHSLSGEWPMTICRTQHQLVLTDGSNLNRFDADGTQLESKALPASISDFDCNDSGDIIAVTSLGQVYVLQQGKDPELKTVIQQDSNSRYGSRVFCLPGSRVLITHDKKKPTLLEQSSFREIKTNDWTFAQPGTSRNTNTMFVTTTQGSTLLLDQTSLRPWGIMQGASRTRQISISPDRTQIALLEFFSPHKSHIVKPTGGILNPELGDYRQFRIPLRERAVGSYWLSNSHLLTAESSGKLTVWSRTPAHVTNLISDNEQLRTDLPELAFDHNSNRLIRFPILHRLVTPVELGTLNRQRSFPGSISSLSPHDQRVSTIVKENALQNIPTPVLNPAAAIEMKNALERVWRLSTTASNIPCFVGADSHLYECLPGSSLPTLVLTQSNTAFSLTATPATTPDGSAFAFGTHDGSVLLRDCISNENLLLIKPTGSAVLALQFSSTGTHLAVLYANGNLLCQELAAPEKPREVLLPNQPFDSICFSPDGESIVAYSNSSTCGIALVNLQTKSAVLHHPPVNSTEAHAAFSSDSNSLFIGTSEGLQQWTLSEVTPHQIHKHAVVAIVCSDQNLFTIEDRVEPSMNVAQTRSDRTRREVWGYSAESPSPETATAISVSGNPVSLRIDNAQKTMFVESVQFGVEVTDLDTLERDPHADLVFRTTPIRHESRIINTSSLSESDLIASLDADGNMVTWDAVSNQISPPRQLTNAGISRTADSPDKDSLYLISNEHDLSFYNHSLGTTTPILPPQPKSEWQSFTILPSPDGEHLAWISNEGHAFVTAISVEHARDEELLPWKRIGSNLESAVWHESGSRIAFFATDDTDRSTRIVTYDTANLKVQSLILEKHQVFSAVFTQENQLVCQTTDQQTVVLSTAPADPNAATQVRVLTNLPPLRSLQKYSTTKFAAITNKGDLWLYDFTSPPQSTHIPISSHEVFVPEVERNKTVTSRDRHWFRPHRLSDELWSTNPLEGLPKVRSLTPSEKLQFKIGGTADVESSPNE